MKQINCPICDTQIKEDKCVRTHFSKFSNKEYKLYHCLNCDIRFWHPLEMIKEAYEDEIDPTYIMHHLGIKDELAEKRTLKFLNNFPLRQGKLLDVGCGEGTFLKCAKKIGFEVWGTDIDGKSIETAKKRGLENLYNLSLEEFMAVVDKKDLKFDVVTFLAVLEHQDNPRKFIKQIKKILKDGGWIVGIVPYGDRKTARIEHKVVTDRGGDYPPHHFTWWSKDAIKNFFGMNGFEVDIWEDECFSTEDISAFMESWLLGNISKYIRRTLRKGIVKKDTKIADSQDLEKLTIKDLEQLNVLSRKKHLFKFLTIVRNLAFSPLAILSKPYFNSTGKSLYFQGRLRV